MFQLNRSKYFKHWIKNLVSRELKISITFDEWMDSFKDRYSKRELKVMKKEWNKSRKNLTLKEAIFSYKPFRRKDGDNYSQYFKSGTGPYKKLVDCDYFSLDFKNKAKKGSFSTSIDIYATDLLVNDYELKT